MPLASTNAPDVSHYSLIPTVRPNEETNIGLNGWRDRWMDGLMDG